MRRTLPLLLAIVLATSACAPISPPYQDGCKTDQQSCITHPGTVGLSIQPQSSN